MSTPGCAEKARIAANEHTNGSRLRMAATVLAIAVASVFFVWSQRSDLRASLDVLNTLEPTALVVALALSGMAVVNRGGLSRSAHRAVGLSADLSSMTRVSGAAYALNKVVKTGGLGGIAVFVRHGEKRKHSPGQVTAACIVASCCSQLALLAIVLTAIAAAAFHGVLPGPWLIAALALIAVACTSLGLLIVATRKRETVRLLYSWPQRAIRAMRSKLGRSQSSGPDFEHADRFHTAATVIRRSPASALPVLGHAVAAKLLGAGVLAASLAATGADIGFGKAMIVYSLALVAAAVGVLPGGVGAVEASMGALLASLRNRSAGSHRSSSDLPDARPLATSDHRSRNVSLPTRADIGGGSRAPRCRNAARAHASTSGNRLASLG